MINLNYKNAQFDYEPYPICYIPDFLDQDLYKQLSESYPDLSFFGSESYGGKKFTLSELNNQESYYSFIKKNKCWSEFFRTVKSETFIKQALGFLEEKNIDLRVKKFRYTNNIKKKQNRLSLLFTKKPMLRSRFEFSVLPASGGQMLPHTDVPAKIVTLVVSFMKPDEWNQEWGGGTSVVLPKKREFIYNYSNKYMPFDEVETIKTFPFNPNQAVLFIKTYDSWHAVNPINGPSGAWRKTVTINIEKLSV